MTDERTFTAAEITESAKAALENWDFDVMEEIPPGKHRAAYDTCSEDAKSEFLEKIHGRYNEAYKAALEITESQAKGLWCEDGPMVLDSAFADVWDWLDEYATNVAANSV